MGCGKGSVDRDRVGGAVHGLRRDRLLNEKVAIGSAIARKKAIGSRERGSALVESLGALVLLLVMVLGVIQISLALYGRNVVISAVHDAARAAVEREAHIPEAHGVARRAIQRAAGGLLRDLNVMVDVTREEGEVVTVRADAVIRAPGPIPLPLPVSATARAARETDAP
jgi:Flp pilus assembly protein TadG